MNKDYLQEKCSEDVKDNQTAIPMNNLQEIILKLGVDEIEMNNAIRHNVALIIDNPRILNIDRFRSSLVSEAYVQKLYLEPGRELSDIKPTITTAYNETVYLRKLWDEPLLNKKYIESRQKIVFDLMENDKVYYQALMLKNAITEEIHASEKANDIRNDISATILYADKIIRLYTAISEYGMPEHIPELVRFQSTLESLPEFTSLKEFFKDSSIGITIEDIIEFEPKDKSIISSSYATRENIFTGKYESIKSLTERDVISDMKSLTERILASPIFEKPDEPFFSLPIKEAIEAFDSKKIEYSDSMSKDIYILSRFWLDEIGKKLINTVPYVHTFDERNGQKLRFGIGNLDFYGADLALSLVLARKARRWKEVGYPVCKPEINYTDSNRFIIEEAYCPTLAQYTLTEAQRRERKMHMPETLPVVRDFHLDKDSSTMMVTGPNMAGKTTILREFAQHIYCALIGGAVLARKAEISLVDQIFSILPGKDNPYFNRGGYLTDITPLANKIKDNHAPLSHNSIALIDEFGKTTDDKEHVEANCDILTLFQKIGVTTLMTTHDKDIIQYAGNLPKTQFMQVCAEHNPETNTLKFTREFKKGIGHSHGEILAKQYGIETELLDKAYEEYKREKESIKKSTDTVQSNDTPSTVQSSQYKIQF